APASGTPAGPKIGCADLRSLTGYDFTVATAVLVPASSEAPEHCRVSGQIPLEVRFEVDLPTAWNRRFYMTGNGGYAGEQFDQRGRIATRFRAVQRGFAWAGTDTGHDSTMEPLGTFAVNRQKLYDYAFRSLHVTAVTAKQLIAAYYGMPQEKSYFEGCSTGGRQALILAQRFPDDFDGIIVGAPVLNFSGTMVRYACTAQALAAAPIPPSKLPLLADKIYKKCDAVDGLADGVIDDPRRCNFQPAQDLPVCSGETNGDDCFTKAQIGTLEKIYGDVMGGGKRLFPGWPVGAEIVGGAGRPGWDPWIVTQQPKSIGFTFGETFFQYLASPEKNSKMTLLNFDFDKDPARLEWIHEILDATDTDLTRFKNRGGRIIMYYGWADPALNPRMGVEYYEGVQKKIGPQTDAFFRLFMVPGMFHCGDGVGTSTFDMLGPLIGWVERGSAPDSIRAARVANGRPNRTRPLCPYPQVAKYKGTGSIDEAASFTCAAPPTM
ncbi:MAG: tannase/feruloyl esterase family alpha/beta hydrolase, partial [Bryobacteraceae bacterium]